MYDLPLESSVATAWQNSTILALCYPNGRACRSVHALAGYGAFVDGDDEDFAWRRTLRAGGCHHAFARPKFHFARGKVGNADNQSTDKILRFVGFFYAGKHI